MVGTDIGSWIARHARRRPDASAPVDSETGDLIVFGRQNRPAYHGVPKLVPEYDVPDIVVGPAERINITLRVSGLEPPS